MPLYAHHQLVGRNVSVAAQNASLSSSWFDGIVVSGDEGVMKPDPRIFRILLERNGIAPQAAVFIDDNPANAAAATRLGIHGIHFRSPAQLRRELAALGLL